LTSFRTQKFHVFPKEIVQTNKKPMEKMRAYLEASTKTSITVRFFGTTWIVAFIWSIAWRWAVEGLGRRVAELAVAAMLGVDVEKVSPDRRYWSGQTQKSGWLSGAKVWKVVQLHEVQDQ
jgi:hypothetical protein